MTMYNDLMPVERLDVYAMKQIERVALLEIISMLDKLNNAKYVYENARDEVVRQDANRMFADSYDWFTRQHFAIKYNTVLHRWFFIGQEQV